MGNLIVKFFQKTFSKQEKTFNCRIWDKPFLSTTIQQKETFNCRICEEPFLSTAIQPLLFDNGAAGDACLRRYCTDCIAQHIEAKVIGNSLADVKCIGLTCNHLFQPLPCRPIIPAKVFEKWCELLCNREILEFEQCYCPNKKCSEVIVDECGDGSVGRSECPICKTSFCFQCMCEWKLWHGVFRCSKKATNKEKNQRLFEKLAKIKKWMSCPTCGQHVELASGCLNIRCRCGTTFCYDCGERITGGGLHVHA